MTDMMKDGQFKLDIKKFQILNSDVQLTGNSEPQTYCENVGRKAAILGHERGVIEVWVYPFKIVHELKFSVFLPEYDIIEQAKDLADRVILRPELTTIIYTHDLFTIQQHLFTPLHEPGAIILLDVDCCTPVEIWTSFIPELSPMWPAGLGGQYTLWDEHLNAYFIGEGSKKYAGLIGSPGARKKSATPGHQLPDAPMKFVVELSVEKAKEVFIPIIITGSSDGKETAGERYSNLMKAYPRLYRQKRDYYDKLRSEFMHIKTPDRNLDLSFEWAKISLDKGLVENPRLGSGLIAGYGVAGKTYRPGFAWFFGGDTCLNSLAINRYGDFEITKQGLTLLRDHQRADGKIFHELTQSAGLINWFDDYPYGFYHAETSAYYIVAVYDYLLNSGDADFVRECYESLKRAYHYCVKADEDNDGLMENSAAGLAAMEVGEMLKDVRVDVYLASIWLKAILCMIELSDLYNDPELKQACQLQFEKGWQSFKKIFVNEDARRLNFAQTVDGEIINESTVWQSLPLFFSLIEKENVNHTWQEFASAAMSSDWGIRSVSRDSRHYDPVSYNQGSVWPFTTGYVATAQYHHHRAINGWLNLQANSNLTYIDAPGWHTELLSGEYYRPLKTSVPHQLFSAAGIINPLVMGLLGLEGNALTRQIVFSPHLPMDWDEVQVNNFRCGDARFDILLQKSDECLMVKVSSRLLEPYQLIFSPAFGLGTKIEKVLLNGVSCDYQIYKHKYDLHCMVETKVSASLNIEITYQPGVEFAIPIPKKEIGAPSAGLKLIDYELVDNLFIIKLEGCGGCNYVVPFKTRFRIHQVEGGTIRHGGNFDWELIIHFDEKKPGYYETKTIIFHLT